jgi:hypothetical protein
MASARADSRQTVRSLTADLLEQPRFDSERSESEAADNRNNKSDGIQRFGGRLTSIDGRFLARSSRHVTYFF